MLLCVPLHTPCSFPSGHASNSMSVAWYTTFYVIWSMYLRHNAPYPATHSEREPESLLGGCGHHHACQSRHSGD